MLLQRLLIVLSVASCASEPAPVEVAEDGVPAVDAAPEVPDVAEAPDAPQAPDVPGVPDAIDVQDEPDVPESPRVEVPQTTWEPRAPMPTPRYAFGAASFGGRVYAVAGFGALDDVAVYNLANDSWDSGAVIGQARSWLGVGQVDGLIYAAGGTVAGEGGTETTESVERYNPGADTWKDVLPLSEPGCCMSAASLSDRLWLFGGHDGSPRVESFSPAQGIWFEHTEMPLGRSRHAAVVVDSRVYQIGGLDGDQPGEIHTAVHVYDTLSDTWSDAPEAPFGRYDSAAASLGGLVWLFGGRDSAGELTDSVFALDPELGWTEAPSLPLARAQHAAIETSDAILLVGGIGPGTAVDALVLK